MKSDYDFIARLKNLIPKEYVPTSSSSLHLLRLCKSSCVCPLFLCFVPVIPLWQLMEPGASSSTPHLGGRAIDRHNPIITDSRRILTPAPSRVASPDVSQLSRRHSLQKGKDKCKGVSRPDLGDEEERKVQKSCYVARSWLKQKGSAFSKDPKGSGGEFALSGMPPTVSTRHLLGNIVLLDDDSSVFTPVSPDRTDVKLSNEDWEQKKLGGSKSMTFPSKAGSDQVVVLRVSLHCRGCARKVRKHLSKMEGVTSFNIDFAAKKVTVVGDVTPLSVLASISKVKNAQFWPVPALPP
ncbi:hypothetical protein MLD38_033117 [Melastoma candidum]|uniref:Uncharacterized protein n=1 Tax=Melastoma candidum TaxID=119954 RepID=A0ACB9M708_9MYRT|nr:hypothetical protein MLD38_033117 [Melastoma candidum]